MRMRTCTPLFSMRFFLHLAPLPRVDRSDMAAEGGEAQKERFKEVLVVFRDRRRPIKFKVSDDPSEDRSSLLHAVQVAFSDVLPDVAADEGTSTSSDPSNYFF